MQSMNLATEGRQTGVNMENLQAEETHRPTVYENLLNGSENCGTF